MEESWTDRGGTWFRAELSPVPVVEGMMNLFNKKFPVLDRATVLFSVSFMLIQPLFSLAGSRFVESSH